VSGYRGSRDFMIADRLRADVDARAGLFPAVAAFFQVAHARTMQHTDWIGLAPAIATERVRVPRRSGHWSRTAALSPLHGDAQHSVR
jgi:hypothetical protein